MVVVQDALELDMEEDGIIFNLKNSEFLFNAL